MYQVPKLTLRQPGCQSCAADNQQCYARCSASACRRCANRCSLLPGKSSQFVVIFSTHNRSHCKHHPCVAVSCAGLKTIIQAAPTAGTRSTSAEEELARRASLASSCVAMVCHNLPSNKLMTLTYCWSVAKTEEGCLISHASDTESESFESSDDVVICDQKPADWIDREPGNSRKRQRDEEDDIIVLDHKPADWIDRPLDMRKRRRAGELANSHPGGER